MEFLSPHRIHPPATDTGPRESSPRRGATGDIREMLSELHTLRPARPEEGRHDSGAYAAATVGESDAIERLRSQIKRIAPYYRTALVTGNPGTGKEGVARMLHALSPCADGEFMAHEAAVLAEAMMRDEAGSILDRISKTPVGGTLYLHEVGEVPMPVQSALLRLWTENGRGKMRVVAGTHRDLRTMGVTGQFRPDLAQRLMGIEIAVPPLMDRREDLPAVVQEILRAIGGERDLRLSSEATTRILAHRWVGDLSELDQVLRAAANAAGRRAQIESGNLPEMRIESDVEEGTGLEKLEDVVRQHVLCVLTRCGGNKLRAAEVLGISRSTLYRMLDSCVGEGFVAG